MHRVATLALGLVLGLGGVGLAGCGETHDSRPDASSAWTELDDAGIAASPARDAQRQRALAAKDELFGALFARLQSVLVEKGAAAAISVCRDEAPALAASTSQTTGVRIGRTSQRLRNPGNTAPDWAQPYVEAGKATPTWLAHEDGRLAGLLPIALGERCLLCHGPEAMLAADVKEALAAHYPDDRATGYVAGDLRGWFWLEVPAP